MQFRLCAAFAATSALSVAPLVAVGISTVLSTASPAEASIVGFHESFVANSANWRNSNGSADLAWFSTGGPTDGTFARSTFNLSATTVGGFPPTVIRAASSYGSSSGAYVGNWITAGVTGVNFMFRHDLAEAVSVTGRFATPINTPGASTVSTISVLPNTWTRISFDLREGSSDIISLGGGTYAAIFSNIGNMQFGFTVPTSLAGQNINASFDITDFNIVPAPSAAALLAIAGCLGAASRRRR